MAQGIVKWFSTEKGYGFIEPDGGGDDVFLHVSALQKSSPQLSAVYEGQRVEFNLTPSRKQGRMSAANIRVVSQAA